MSTAPSVRPAMRLLLKSGGKAHAPPIFLLPSLAATQTSSFSSTPTSFRRVRDNNPDRGVSTARRTGPRQPLSVSKTALPRPVLNPKRRSQVQVAEDHGLWDFFHSKEKPMNTPEEDDEHGRPWSVEELRAKSWEDLHSLWWVCAKERNRIATENFERESLGAGYGDHESKQRDIVVRRTQRAIKHVLTERYYTWQDAQAVAESDPEMDMSAADGKIYRPSDDWYENDKVGEEEVFESQDVETVPGRAASPNVETVPEVQILPKAVSESNTTARPNV